jgi:hypothetical protein
MTAPESPPRARDAQHAAAAAAHATHDARMTALAARRAELGTTVLVGGEGGDFIASALSSASDVAGAIDHVRALGALLDSDCDPLLGLLGSLGVGRAQAYEEMLSRALAEVTRRVPTLPQGTLLSLLDASFPYIGIEELKVVPLTVFAHMIPVPSSYLKQLSRDAGLFRQLPTEVQRQCWALDAGLLRRHALPSIVAYGDEKDTLLRNVDQDLELTVLKLEDDWLAGEGATTTASARAKAGASVKGAAMKSRRALRTASASVNRLKKIIGTSRNAYIEVIRLCRKHFESNGDDASCSLRSQLLMAYHDAGETELCSADKCHRLAWLMDACIRDRYLDSRRLHEMASIIDAAVAAATKVHKKKAPIKAPARPQSKPAAQQDAAKTTRFRLVGVGGGKKKDKAADDSENVGAMDAVEHQALSGGMPPPPAPTPPPVSSSALAANEPTATRTTKFRIVGAPKANKDGNESDDGGSISRVPDRREQDDTFEQVSGDMGMILRDPPVLHLLLHEVIRTLQGVIEAEKQPKDEQRLHELTRFLCLGLTSQALLRENTNGIPKVPAEITVEFFPILGDLMLSAMLRDSDDDMDVEDGEAPETSDMSEAVRQKLLRLMTSIVVRKIALTFVLVCLQNDNIRTATEVLEVAATVMTEKDIADESAFAVTLARRVASMISKKQTATDSALWKHGVEGILLRSTSASLEAHDAVLQLLIASASGLSAKSLSSAVEATLVNTKKTRKHRRKGAKKIVYEYEPIVESHSVRHGSSANLDLKNTAASESFDAEQRAVTVDVIRSTYQMIASKFSSKLNDTNAPVLFDYVRKRSKRDAGALIDDEGPADYFDDEDDGSLMELGLDRSVKSPSVIRDSPLMSPR